MTLGQLGHNSKKGRPCWKGKKPPIEQNQSQHREISSPKKLSDKKKERTIGSMYGIFTHIYYKNQLVGKCTSPMDPMGNGLLGFFGLWFLALEGQKHQARFL